jgi:hypothetical protein
MEALADLVTTSDQVRYATVILRQTREDLESVLLELSKYPDVVKNIPSYSAVWGLNKEIVRAINELTRYEMRILDDSAWSDTNPVTRSLKKTQEIIEKIEHADD